MKSPQKNQSTLTIKALTWLRDSHGLFDYESFQLNKNTLKIDGPCVIGRCGDEIRLLTEAEAATPSSGGFEKIANVRIQHGIAFQYI